MKKLILALNLFLVVIACFILQSTIEQEVVQISEEEIACEAAMDDNQNMVLQDSSVNVTGQEGTYLKSYFEGLTTNMGSNTVGSCGFVAIGMLLSYYDSFLDDNIILEQYDVTCQGNESDMVARKNSPGILNDYTGIERENKKFEGDNEKYIYYWDIYSRYLDKVYEMEETSLQAKLISIGYDNHIVEFSDVVNQNPYAINTTEMMVVLKAYFDDFIKMQGYKIEQAKGHFVVESFVKDNLQKGNPVLTWCTNPKTNDSHAFICYDYDSEKDIIYANMGWGAGSTHYNFISEYPHFEDAIVLTFPNKEHTHSYNYEVQHGDHVDKYCYCDEFIRTDSNTQLNNPVKRKCDILEGTYTIPSWATYINSDVYQNNEQIKNLNFESDSKLEYIPNNAFKGCKNLRSVSFSTGIDYIGERAFEDCISLYYIDFGNSLIKEVGYGAFNNCTALKYSKYTEFGVHLSTDIFYIPKSFTYIGELAFSNCKNIGEIIVKGNINKICFATFGDCTSLKNITFSSKVQTIESYAFRGCSSLKNATFSSGLSEIYDYVFSNTGLTHFEIPDGVTYIGDEVFYGCKYLTSVLLPSSVTYIGSDALSGGDETTSGQVTIYTERSAPYNGWSNNWNGGRPVFFGCTLSEDKTYVETINTALLKNKDAENGINPPYRKRYKFDGWYLNSSFTGTKYDVNSAITANPGVLYTKWKIDLTQGI